MKTGDLNDLLMWENRLARIVGICHSKTLIVEFLDHSRCPHCQKNLGPERFSVVEAAPLFQSTAKPVKSINP